MPLEVAKEMQVEPISFHGVFIQKDEHYIAYIEEIPGVNTQGDTLEETKDNLLEALQLILLANRELAERELKEKASVGEIPSSKITRESIPIPAV
jgi:predicted RNase H-like HicB family nuclease